MQRYYLERLSVRHWLWAIWPRIVAERGARACPDFAVYFVEGGRLAQWLAGYQLRRVNGSLRKLELDAGRMFDEAGALVWLRLSHRDMFEVLADVRRKLALAVSNRKQDEHLMLYLIKRCLPGVNNLDRSGMWRALWVFEACRWHAGEQHVPPQHTAVYLLARPWAKSLAAYAAVASAVSLRFVGAASGKWDAVKRLAGRDARLAYEVARRVLRGRGRATSLSGMAPGATAPCIAAQYYGQFNLDLPNMHSDFFFWQQSELSGRHLLAVFGFPQDPLDEGRHRELASHGIRAVALRYAATSVEPPPVFDVPAPLRGARDVLRVLRPRSSPAEAQWIESETVVFEAQRDYWRRLFVAHNAKIFTTWFKYTADHCVIGAAINDVGGVLALYQRAYEGNPNAKFAAIADVTFSFAQAGALTEAGSGSRIAYHVTTGYLGDHRFPLVAQAASRLRAALTARGARHIAAFFDESSFDDPRWGPGHAGQRAHYAFLLEKVLEDAGFGLVLKPKSPASLRRRLGPVTALLDQALATGRCTIFDEGRLQGSVPPAQAALAADLAIHGSVSSGTAGMEAALAGVPTVLVDEEGWTMSPLYRLGTGLVVFREFETMWHTWREHRACAGGIPGFGDWSPMLEELDPFRDGLAARRMGTYLKWLIEGFERGGARESVLADAAEQYCSKWGSDKIVAVSAR